MSNDAAAARGRTGSQTSIWQTIYNSFMKSVGDVVFGMEDGTVSIFGLVFGLAVSANSSKAVLLAGATGAAAAAVSMMAGAYLDVESRRSIAQAAIEQERKEIKQHPQKEAAEVIRRLIQNGVKQQEAQSIVKVLRNHPDVMLEVESAFELQTGGAIGENPYAHAVWMLLADLIAASIPVIPFAFLAVSPARIVSVIITALLLLAVGIGRGIVSHRNIWFTAFETLGVAAAAAAAGVLIGKLITVVAG